MRNGMMPMASKLSKINKKLDIPVVSAVFAFILCIIWMTIHYITQKFQILPTPMFPKLQLRAAMPFI
jgi:APA family basic amino acid/polyamine antiporter